MKRHALPVVLTVVMVAGAMATSDVRAASLTLNPNTPLVGLPGSTIGWGYTITGDPARTIVAYFGLGSTLNASDGSVSFDVFDYPEVPAGTTQSRGYDPQLPGGLFELTLPGALAPGTAVTGAIFGAFFFDNETTQEFELPFTARVAAAPVPEPSTLLLLLGGAAGLLRRRARS